VRVDAWRLDKVFGFVRGGVEVRVESPTANRPGRWVRVKRPYGNGEVASRLAVPFAGVAASGCSGVCIAEAWCVFEDFMLQGTTDVGAWWGLERASEKRRGKMLAEPRYSRILRAVVRSFRLDQTSDLYFMRWEGRLPNPSHAVSTRLPRWRMGMENAEGVVTGCTVCTRFVIKWLRYVFGTLSA